MRNGHSDDALRRLAADLWMRRGDRYSELRGEAVAGCSVSKVETSFIGG